MSFIEELVKKRILNKEEVASLEKEAKSSGKKEEEIILERKILSEDVLFELKSEYLKIPLRKPSPDEVSPEILKTIPEETAKFYKMIPLGKEGDFIEIGMVYPEDLDAQEALKFLSRSGKFNYRVFLITPTTLKDFLIKYRTLRKEVKEALKEIEREIKVERVERPAEIERLAEEAPIAKVVAVILRYAVEGKASDIHIEPMKDKLRIRFRMLGILYSSIFLPIRIHPTIVSRIKILANLRIDETRIPQDGRFTARIGGRGIDFRISTFPTILGEKVAIRVLDPRVGLKKFDELGLEGRSFEIVKKAIQKPYGMILATGPTGCGKTTTLYAILQILNREGVNIMTLEDPVEYFIEGINQSQIKPEIGYDFANGLKHIVRQDPDIIMVGEIRDPETASLATHAALTGHILLSTLHTANALGVIPRLIDLGVQPFLIPPTLSVAIAQRLARKLCPHCRMKAKPGKKIESLILEKIKKLPEKVKKRVKQPLTIFKPKGCKYCHHTGFLGRIGLFEVLEMTPQLSEIILTEPSETKIAQEAKRQGMITMMQDGILKALNGITTIEEVLRVAEEI